MAVRFIYWLHCLSANNTPCLAPQSPPTPEAWENQQMIVETTCRARKNVRMR